MHLPSTYKRLVAARTGKSFREVARVIEVPLKLPSEENVLIKVSYAGVNGGCESFRARGEHAFSGNVGLEDFPLGAECVGIVAAVGGASKSKLLVGSVVSVQGAGGFSEYVLAKPSQCTAIEADQPGPHHAALALSGLTAITALEAAGKVKPGDRVIINAAAGGTGHIAIQVALNLGAELVVGICRGSNKVEAVKSLRSQGKSGQLEVIDYKSPEMLDGELGRLSPSGFDLAWDGVGGEMRCVMLSRLRPSGRLLQVGYISGYPHMGSSNAYSEEEGVFWGGTNMVLSTGQSIIGNIWPKDPLAIARSRKKLYKLYHGGHIQVLIDKSRHFKGVESIPDSVDHMLEGKHIGKVVVEL